MHMNMEGVCLIFVYIGHGFITEFCVPPRLMCMRKRPCHVFFCLEANGKIENLDTKRTILKNISIRNAGLSHILQEGISF